MSILILIIRRVAASLCIIKTKARGKIRSTKAGGKKLEAKTEEKIRSKNRGKKLDEQKQEEKIKV